MNKEMGLEEWEKTVPRCMQLDPLWRSVQYRLAMYQYDLAWLDCITLRQDFRGREIVSQLVRSVGGICANMEESYGRGLGTPDNTRILRIALGETREVQGWYFRARHILSDDLIERRINVIDQIIRLLVNHINRQRKALPNP